MKCLSCGGESLVAKVTIDLMVPLADRGGTIKIGGLKLGQVTAKEAWDLEPTIDGSKKDRVIRGPIYCADCNTEHYYVVGSKRSLREGSYDAAVHARAEGSLEP